MDLEIIIFFAAIIEVITLVCFFILCSNVGELKRRLLNNGATCTSMFSMYMAMGDKESAKRALIKVILADTQVQNALNSTPEHLLKVMAKYSKQMKEVDLIFDANKAIVCKNMF